MATVMQTPNSFANVMDIFRGAPVNPQQAGGPNNPNTPNTAPNGVIPPNTNPDNPNANAPDSNNPANQDPNKKPETPLDKYTTLWDPVKDDGNKGDPGLDFGNVDPKKMMEAAQRVDFTQILNPEMQAAIAKGGEEGVKATLTAMNMVAQTVYAQGAMATTKIVGEAVKQARQEVAAQIPGLVKAAVVSNQLASSNPVFQNPAVKPIVEGLKSQLMVKFPDATPDQLQELAQNYFLGVSQMMGTGKGNNQNSDTNTPGKKIKNMTGKGDEAWDEFFGVKLS